MKELKIQKDDMLMTIQSINEVIRMSNKELIPEAIYYISYPIRYFKNKLLILKMKYITRNKTREEKIKIINKAYLDLTLESEINKIMNIR